MATNPGEDVVVRKPLLLSYGGGHANIIIALAKELERRGIAFDLLGLTTAKAAFQQAGLLAEDANAILDPETRVSDLARARSITPRADHPDIDQSATDAYFAVGFRDLCDQYGLAEATRRVGAEGRKAFEPVSSFTRFLRERMPSVLITTTSPRFELASIKAARDVGIPSIAVGDMYLIAEAEWIAGGTYADHLTVISDEVEDFLRSVGPLDSKVHVLGNPAFDVLAPAADDDLQRASLRKSLGVEDKTVILWPLGGAEDPVAGRTLVRPETVAQFFDRFCERHPQFTYLLRPHPNWPVGQLRTRHGAVDRDLTLEQSLLVCDVVCVEASTVGLQAVLRGIPTICVDFADYVVYPGLGWARAVTGLGELEAVLAAGDYFAPPAELRSQVGRSAMSIIDLALDVAASGPVSDQS